MFWLKNHLDEFGAVQTCANLAELGKRAGPQARADLEAARRDLASAALRQQQQARGLALLASLSTLLSRTHLQEGHVLY